MAQAQAFETDFWKDANLRKVWDDIVPGEPRKTMPYLLTIVNISSLLISSFPSLFFLPEPGKESSLPVSKKH